VRIENDLPIALADHNVGETRWTPVQSAGRVDHRAVAPGGRRRWYVSGAGHDVRLNALKPVLSLASNRHPDELHGQTGPVRHPAQLPTGSVPARARQQFGKYLADHRSPLDPVRRDQLSATQRHYRVTLAPSYPG
jgi:hypothetical protein